MTEKLNSSVLLSENSLKELSCLGKYRTLQPGSRWGKIYLVFPVRLFLSVVNFVYMAVSKIPIY